MKQAHNEFNGYFLWLGSLVDVDWDRYEHLMYLMYEMDFVWCLELDSSRVDDAMALREEYYDLDPSEDWIMLSEKPASVLEVLITLARRMDDVVIDIDTGDRTRFWFWEFVSNLGLKKYTDLRLFGDEYGHIDLDSYEDDMIDIQVILENWMNRTFEWDGKGSIFPIDDCVRDQRERPITYQMADYIYTRWLLE